jgi:hypothetical protein
MTWAAVDVHARSMRGCSAQASPRCWTEAEVRGIKVVQSRPDRDEERAVKCSLRRGRW